MGLLASRPEDGGEFNDVSVATLQQFVACMTDRLVAAVHAEKLKDQVAALAALRRCLENVKPSPAELLVAWGIVPLICALLRFSPSFIIQQEASRLMRLISSTPAGVYSLLTTEGAVALLVDCFCNRALVALRDDLAWALAGIMEDREPATMKTLLACGLEAPLLGALLCRQSALGGALALLDHLTKTNLRESLLVPPLFVLR